MLLASPAVHPPPEEVSPLFGRSKTQDATLVTAPGKEGGKGRPTPSRREAEAARKARAKGPTDKKEAARYQRERRAEANAKMRQGMKTGDDRYLIYLAAEDRADAAVAALAREAP